MEPPRPEVRPPFPGALGKLALDCLAKDPAARPTMARVAERLAAAALVRPHRMRRIALFAAAALALVTAVAIAAPQLFDPLTGRWFGAPPFRALQRGARAAHEAIVP